MLLSALWHLFLPRSWQVAWDAFIRLARRIHPLGSVLFLVTLLVTVALLVLRVVRVVEGQGRGAARGIPVATAVDMEQPAPQTPGDDEDVPSQPAPPRHHSTQPADPDEEPNPGDPGPPLLKRDRDQDEPHLPGGELPRGI